MSTILTSIHGHKVGLDVNGYLTCPVGIKVPVVYTGPSGSEVQQWGSATTVASTATSIPGGGTSVLTASTSGTYSLAAPVAAGLELNLAVTSSSTLTRAVTMASGTFLTSGMSTGATASITEPGMYAFVSISTAQYMPVSAYTTSSISYA